MTSAPVHNARSTETYQCKECGGIVVLRSDGTRERPCGHEGTILCTIAAEVVMYSGVGREPLGGR